MDLENFRYSLKSLKKCDQYWDEMNPVSGGRMCNSCNKKIVDFTSMTYTEIAVYMSESDEPVCGFYLPEQLNGIRINKLIPTAIGLGTLFLASNVSAEQAPPEPNIAFYSQQSTSKKTVESTHRITVDTVITVKGKILDQDSEWLPGVSVIVKGTGIGTISDINGDFTLRHTIGSADSITLVVSSIGFRRKEIAVPVDKLEYDLGNIILEPSGDLIQFYVTKRLPWHKRQWRKFVKLFR